MFKIISFYLLFISLLSLSTQICAQTFTITNESDVQGLTTVEWNDCTSVATATIPLREDGICGLENILRNGTISAITPIGITGLFTVTQTEYPLACTLTSITNDGHCWDYAICGNTAVTMQIITGEGNEEFMEFKIPTLPNTMFGELTKLNFFLRYEQDVSNNGFHFNVNFDISGDRQAEIDPSPMPSEIVVDDCNRVTVKGIGISDPQGAGNSCANHWTVEVYRDGSKIGEIDNSSTTELVDASLTLIAGQSYEYTTITKWLPRYNGVNYRQNVMPVSAGRTITIPQYDGRISGNVKTLSGFLVPDVEIKATLLNPQDLIACPNLSAPVDGYMTETDDNGAYTIPHIYFGKDGDPDAEYQVEGFLAGHSISMDTVLLNDSDPGVSNNVMNVELIDSTAVTLHGMVTDFGGCPIDSVAVFAFLPPPSTFPIPPDSTDTMGDFALTLPGQGEYMISVSYRDFTLDTLVMIDSLTPDSLYLIYDDTEMIEGFVGAGCAKYLGEATVVARVGGCILSSTDIDNDGHYMMTVPKRPITLEVGPFTPNSNSEQSGTLFDSKELDMDSSEVVDFIFSEPLKAVVRGLPDRSCSAIFEPILKQGVNYPLVFVISEGAAFCNVDTGYVQLTEYISQTGQFDTILPISNGRAYYDMRAGPPNISAPYTKNISYTAVSGGQTSITTDRSVIVTGARLRGNTFATTAPQIPYLILRDPPGDQSYAFLEESQTITTSQSFSTQDGGGVNVWGKVRSEVGIPNVLKVYGEVGASLDVSGYTNESEEFIYTMTSTQRFQTSDSDALIGERGDVFIGAAVNLIYALADEIKFDLSNCTIDRDTSIIIDHNGFDTEFTYTESHIRNSVIPNLYQIINTTVPATPQAETAIFEAERSIHVWEQILALNQELKESAFESIDEENFSLDGGVGPKSVSFTESATESRTIEFQTEVNALVAAEAGFALLGTGPSGGVKVNFRTIIGESSSTTTTNSTTTGYVLDDDDDSDNFTIDIVRDPVYGTPVFKLLAGETSCPYEEGTASINVPSLMVSNPVQYLQPGSNSASYNFQIANQSETDDAGTYMLELLNLSVNGASVKYNGASVTAPIPFVLSTGQNNITINVERLNNSNYSFEGITFLFYPACSRREAVSAQISAFFQSDCSSITLASPSDDWLVNQASNDMLSIIMQDYDLSTDIDNVRIEYKKSDNNAWLDAGIVLTKSQLNNNPSVGNTVVWNTTSIADSTYDIRLRLDCDNIINYSERTTGVIDRTGPLVFGTEQPIDDDYAAGDEISVYFNEEVNCNALTQANVNLTLIPENTIINAQFMCEGRKLTITPDSDISTLLGKNFEVNITGLTDLYGNPSSTPISWTFGVGNIDTDLDGISDSQDACSGGDDFKDTDVDGAPDACDCSPVFAALSTSKVEDADCDGYIDSEDLCPTQADASMYFNINEGNSLSSTSVRIRHEAELSEIVTGDFTFSLWATELISPNTGDYDILSKGSGPKFVGDGPNMLYRLGTTQGTMGSSDWTTRRLRLYLSDGTTGEWGYSADLLGQFDGDWKHIHVSFKQSTNTATFYLNGEEKGSHVYATLGELDHGNIENFYLGRNHDYIPSTGWIGQMDEMAILSRALPPCDIERSMVQRWDPADPDLVAYYDFNDGQPYGRNYGNWNVVDHSGNSFDGRVYDTNLTLEHNPYGRTWVEGVNKVRSCNSERLILYVDKDVQGGNQDGSTWDNAYATVQDALYATNSQVGDIWVAEGTYYPDEGGLSIENDRNASFAMKHGVGIYGGFDGTETLRSERDIINHLTILSGDIDQNDDVSGNTQNSYHVICNFNDTGCTPLGSSAIIDGFTVMAGHANGSYPDNTGAGMLNYLNNPMISHMTFLNNHASDAGAMNNRDAYVTIKNSKFLNNSAINHGGAIMNQACNACPVISISNSIFSQNTAATGGGIATFTSNVELVNTLFTDNISTIVGGGMFISVAKVTIDNITMTDNSTANAGGSALYIIGGVGNTLDATYIKNGILWGNTGNEIVTSNNADPIVSYSIIEGGYAGTANLDVDPLFVDTDNPPGPDGLWMTADDGLALSANSPAVDAGSDINISHATDIIGHPHVNMVDMGAYEQSCLAELNLTNILNGNTDYTSGSYISSDQVIGNIDPNIRVTYDAKTEIRLLKSFEIKKGVVFQAFISGCGNN